MRKLILSLGLVLTGFSAMSQVIFNVEAPASIGGFYDFTSNGDGSSWGLANLAGVQVLDTVMLVDDGTPGIDSYGIDSSAYGCSGSTMNDLTGKIALIRRGSCGFGVKALNAQNAGAVAVIIWNRDETLVNMNGGTEGASVTIPVVFVQASTGDAIVNAMNNGDDVVAFIGDKTGYFGDDVSVFDNKVLRAEFGAKPLALAQNAADLTVPFGAWVYNYGQNDQTGVAVNTVVTRDGVQVYSQTSTPADIFSGDSAYFTTPALALATYQAGEYVVSYNVTYGVTDQFAADNVSSYTFNLGNLWSLVHEDTATTVHVDGYYRANTLPTSQFESCMALKDANASRVATDGAYFGGFAVGVADTATVDLTGFEVALSIYEWNDADITQTNGTFDALNEVATGSYVFPGEDEETTIFIPIEDANTGAPYYRFNDDQTYLICLNSFEPKLYLAFSTADVYDYNVSQDDLLRFPLRNDGTTWSIGFGISPSLALHTATDLNVNENLVEAAAYPNPSKDVITVKVNVSGDATLTVNDLAGRTVSTGSVKINNGQFTTNVAGMNAGTYVFSLEYANGTSSRFNVVVTK